ncbi:MAG: hypothetical protein JSW39_29245 [Desulfobacterales bacterium]|nr:MAG: hypothetical protein JSW39_29245 [Desulfobacterales bacterium]
MAAIVILGAGVMGTAFSVLLADCGHKVFLVGTHLDKDLIQGIREHGTHAKLKVRLPDGVAPFTHDQLGEVLSNPPDLIVFGVNSAGVEWATDQLTNYLQASVPILMLTKGLAVKDDTICILPDIVRRRWTGHGLQVGGVAGPCIAGELAARRDSSMVITHPDAALRDWLVRLVNASYCHARPSQDIVGVEACAALKNFYALGVGFANGLLTVKGPAENGALMNNVAAGLFVEAVREIRYLIDFLGGDPASVYGLAGVGDLYVTCQAGRNSRMGKLLGTGLPYSEAKAKHMPDETIEGAELALAIGATFQRLLEQRQIARAQLPLAITLLDAVCRDQAVQIPWNRFYTAP